MTTRRYFKAMAFLALVALAGCNGGGGGYAGADNPIWGQMMGMGYGMATYQPTRPTITNCSSFGMRGQGFNCVTQ
jgi:hypothetical protein